MATKNLRYTPPQKTEAEREHQKQLFLAYLPMWGKMSTEDIVTLTAILFAYLTARLKGYRI